MPVRARLAAAVVLVALMGTGCATLPRRAFAEARKADYFAMAREQGTSQGWCSMTCRRLSVVVLLLAASVGLSAHDFWLAASPWEVTPGARVTVTANVGDRFPVPTSFTAPERVDRLRVIGPEGELSLQPQFRRQENSLATDVQLPGSPGSYLIVMTIKPRFIEIKAPDFATYLRHEGLERVLAEREKAGEVDRVGRERYSRYAKVVIRAGDGPADHVTRPLGLGAELVPLSDPSRLRVGESLGLRLLVNGRPVVGALVGGIYAASKGAPDDWPLKARTDQNGDVRFTLDHAGGWLFRSVHMTRASEPGTPAADWESFWASLTFEVAHSR